MQTMSGLVAAGVGMNGSPDANGVLHGWSGAVVAKITVLVAIIVFIQKRPQGIFALKGRFVE